MGTYRKNASPISRIYCVAPMEMACVAAVRLLKFRGARLLSWCEATCAQITSLVRFFVVAFGRCDASTTLALLGGVATLMQCEKGTHHHGRLFSAVSGFYSVQDVGVLS